MYFKSLSGTVLSLMNSAHTNAFFSTVSASCSTETSLCFHLDSKNNKNITALCSTVNSGWSLQYLFRRHITKTLITQTHSSFPTHSFFLAAAWALWSEGTEEGCQGSPRTHFLQPSLSKLCLILPFHFSLFSSSLQFFVSWAMLSWNNAASLFRQCFHLSRPSPVLPSSPYCLIETQIQTLQCISSILLKQFLRIFHWNTFGLANHNQVCQKALEEHFSLFRDIGDTVHFVWRLSYSTILLNHKVPTVTFYRNWSTESICSNNWHLNFQYSKKLFYKVDEAQ